MIANLVYVLCALGSAGCALLLIRQFARTRTRLLLWASLCFLGLAFNNAFLVIDLVLFPELDLLGMLIRNGVSAVTGALLLFGLIWELT